VFEDITILYFSFGYQIPDTKIQITALTKKETKTIYKNLSSLFFLFGIEGPRSRSYGRTAALRLIVQPCDENEEKDDQFFHFSK
jgi:hypothetical protein